MDRQKRVKTSLDKPLRLLLICLITYRVDYHHTVLSDNIFKQRERKACQVVISRKESAYLSGIPRWSRMNRVPENIFQQQVELPRVPFYPRRQPHFTRKNRDSKGENSLRHTEQDVPTP